jgi:hypothetical protein
MLERLLFALLTLLLLGSVGAFFFYVPVFPVFVTVVILGSLVLMFWLGLYVRSLWSGNDDHHQAGTEKSH